MARIGYARVSSVGQSLEVQLAKLTDCDKIYQEKRSGASLKRPRLDACLEYVREGDTLVVTRLDRLARSTLHLCQIAEELRRKQVHLQVLDQQIGDHCKLGAEDLTTRLPTSAIILQCVPLAPLPLAPRESLHLKFTQVTTDGR